MTRTGNPRRASMPFVLGLVAVAAAAWATGCKDSSDVAGPAPVPVPDVAGAWTGTFQFAEPAFYYSETFSAQASLQQTGTSVEGTITISGSPTVTIHATISNEGVSGTASLTGTIQDSSGAGTVVGGFRAPLLTITIHPHDPSMAGTVFLRR